ncbi:MAG TPA: MFS transporter [Candidatus Binatia bacterium]|nr:MFS transporter [Candidatus Binatia bacterium]
MAELGSLPEMPIAPPRRGALGPLHEPLFRTLWIAAVVSYTGTWMQNVGAAWLMTALTMSPLMVGLVQAAGSIAVFLIVLPAGAIADMVDRRKLLLFTQTWMVLAAAGLGALTLAGKITPGLLLLLTLLMGFGAVLNDPAWQAITPEIVSQQNFAAGVAWNSAGFNVARAVGPALGGLVIAAAGSGIAFLLNAVSFFGVIYFLYRWRRKRGRSPLRAGHMMRAMFEGFRHMRGSRPVKAVLVRSALFSISASALPALLPLLAHPFGSQGYGLLLGFFGLGALAGAGLIPLFRRSLSADALVSVATAVFAFTTYAAARWTSFALLSVTMLVAGLAWIQILASLNVSAQTMCPAHMRARAISMYLLVLQGGLAGGAALWGEIAEHFGMYRSLTYAALGLVIGVPAALWFKLHMGDVQPVPMGMD